MAEAADTVVVAAVVAVAAVDAAVVVADLQIVDQN